MGSDVSSFLFSPHFACFRCVLLITILMCTLSKKVPFAASKQLLLSANPKQLKNERLENNLRLCGESWLTNSKFYSLIDMTTVHSFIIPALDTRSHVLSIQGRRSSVEKPVFKLAPLGSGQTFTLVTPELSVTGVSLDVLQRVLAQSNKVLV